MEYEFNSNEDGGGGAIERIMNRYKILECWP